MLQRISNFSHGKNERFAGFAAAVLVALSLGCSLAPLFAQETGQRTFASAEDASRAFFAAMQAQDEQAALSILGSAGKEVLSSGDPVEDLDDGRHNGLYWQGASDEFDSPINPLIAYARQNLPTDQVGEHVPFNGYMFRILTSQGRHAPGGAKNYIVDGKMSAGFAFVAYPVEYRSSGVMTFIVNESGTIYEKDLGPNTTKLAQAMTAYDPDSTWHKAE